MIISSSMHTTIIFLILAVLFLSASGCTSTSSKYNKQAVKLESAGLMEEASEKYRLAVTEDKNNIDAMIGLKRTAQNILELKLVNVEQLFQKGNNQAVVNHVNSASRYLNSIKGLGIKLNWPRGINEMYFKAKSTLKNARIAETYRSGVTSLSSRNYRTAYNYFDEVLGDDPNYKDAYELKQEALNSGIVRVGVFPFKNTTYSRGVEAAVQATMLAQLMAPNDPFLKFIDREYLRELLTEQKLGLSGIVDEATAAEAGRIIGLGSVVFGKIYEVTEDDGHRERDQLRAYEVKSRQVQETYYIGTIPMTRYLTQYYGIPVMVNTYTGSNSVRISAQVNIISTETAQILKTETITATESDDVNYAECGGCDYSKLSKDNPGDQTPVGGALTNLFTLFLPPVDKSLFSAGKKLTPLSQLKSIAEGELGEKIADALLIYYLAR